MFPHTQHSKRCEFILSKMKHTNNNKTNKRAEQIGCKEKRNCLCTVIAVKWHNWSYIPRIFWVRHWCKLAERPMKCRSMQRIRCSVDPRVPEYWIAYSRSQLIPFLDSVCCCWGSYDDGWLWWASKLIMELVKFGHHGVKALYMHTTSRLNYLWNYTNVNGQHKTNEKYTDRQTVKTANK